MIVMLSFTETKVHALHEDGRFEVYDLEKRRKKMRLGSPVHSDRWAVPEDSLMSSFYGGIMCLWIRASNKVRIYSPKGNNKYLDVPNPIDSV